MSNQPICIFRTGMLALCLLLATGCNRSETALTDRLLDVGSRVWIGQDFYANRLMDWQLNEGRIECIKGRIAKPMCTLHLLTRALGEAPGSVRLSVETGPIAEGGPAHANMWTGSLVGAGGHHVDFRISSLTHHWPGEDGGLIFAVDGTGRIVARSNAHDESRKGPRSDFTVQDWPAIAPASYEGAVEPYSNVRLSLESGPGSDGYTVTVSAADGNGAVATARFERLDAIHFTGNIALVSHDSARMEGPAGTSYRPKVFDPTIAYTVTVIGPENARQILENIWTVPAASDPIEVAF